MQLKYCTVTIGIYNIFYIYYIYRSYTRSYMRREVSLNEPHIILFLNEIEKHGRSIVKLGDCLYEVRTNEKRGYLVSGLNKNGTKEDLLLVSLIELFEEKGIFASRMGKAYKRTHNYKIVRTLVASWRCKL